MPSTTTEQAAAMILQQGEASASPMPLSDDATLDWVAQESGPAPAPDYRWLTQKAGNIALSQKLLQPRADRERCFNDGKGSGIPADWLSICRDKGDADGQRPDGSLRLRSHTAVFGGHGIDLADWIVGSFINGT